jgi:hypothetical protein
MLASMTTWGLPARFQRLSINSAPPDSTPWNRIAVPSLSITSCRESIALDHVLSRALAIPWGRHGREGMRFRNRSILGGPI